SLFYYVPSESRWKQVWITDTAPVLGGVKEKRALPIAGAGVRFQGELIDRDRVILDRTTLTPLGDGRVQQVIETSVDGGTPWKVQFDAIYERQTRASRGAPAAGALSASETAAVRAATLAYP